MTIMRAAVSVAVLGVAAVASWAFAADSGEKKPAKRTTDVKADPKPAVDEPVDEVLSRFMRLKLDASGKILDGLAIEDFALIKGRAQQLSGTDDAVSSSSGASSENSARPILGSRASETSQPPWARQP